MLVEGARHRVSRAFASRVGPPVAFTLACWAASIGKTAPSAAPPPLQTSTAASESCFLLYELGVGEVRRDPAAACSLRVGRGDVAPLAAVELAARALHEERLL